MTETPFPEVFEGLRLGGVGFGVSRFGDSGFGGDSDRSLSDLLGETDFDFAGAMLSSSWSASMSRLGWVIASSGVALYCSKCIM